MSQEDEDVGLLFEVRFVGGIGDDGGGALVGGLLRRSEGIVIVIRGHSIASGGRGEVVLHAEKIKAVRVGGHFDAWFTGIVVLILLGI